MSDKFQNRYRIPSARASWWDYSQNGLYFITICTANREPILGKIENKKMVLSPIGIIVTEEWEKSFSIRNELFCDIYVIMPNHIHAILRIDNNDETNGGNDTIVGGNTNGGGGANGGGNTNGGNNDSNGGCTNVETHGRASLPSYGRAFDQLNGRAFDQLNDRAVPSNGRAFQTNDPPFQPTNDPPFQPSNDGTFDPLNQSFTNNHGVAVRVPKSISSFVAGFKSAATVQINQYRKTPGKPVWQTRFHDHIIRDDESYHRIWHYIKNNPAKWNEDTFFKE